MPLFIEAKTSKFQNNTFQAHDNHILVRTFVLFFMYFYHIGSYYRNEYGHDALEQHSNKNRFI